MDIDDAVEQISEIHKHLAKSEIFYGYKPKAVMSVGIIAFMLAVFQSWVVIPLNDSIFLIQWLIAAAVIIIFMAGNIIYNYLKHGSNFEIHQMSKVLIQFVPSLVGGSIITAVFFSIESSAMVFLPGIWAVFFGLGIFSMRPYLPGMIGLLTLYYFISGAALLCLVRYNLSFSPWGLGLTFGFGHLFAALILQLDIKRGNDGN